MIRQKQLFRHEPEKQQFGDCHRTALACLLNIPVEDSPHFIGEWELREQLKAQGLEVEFYSWQDEQEAWLNSLGYTTIDVCYNPEVSVEEVMRCVSIRNPDIYYLIAGTSPRGTNHSVIAHGPNFDWDPHMDGGFLVAPLDNGVWEVTFLLPIICKEVRNGPL